MPDDFAQNNTEGGYASGESQDYGHSAEAQVTDESGRFWEPYPASRIPGPDSGPNSGQDAGDYARDRSQPDGGPDQTEGQPGYQPGQSDMPKGWGVTPDSYGEFDLPGNMQMDNEALTQFKQIAAGRGMSKQEAQSLINLQVGMEQKRVAQYVNMVRGWAEEIGSDPVYGGGRLQHTVSDAKLVLQRYDRFGLRDELERSGYGNHPKLVKFLAEIGRSLKDDNVITSRHRSSSGPRTALRDALWPDYTMPK